MSPTDEFIKYCSQILKANFGPLSNGIIKKVQSKKKLNDASNYSDFEEFIDLIELNISILSGKNNAVKMCNIIRGKAIELAKEQKLPEFSISNKIEEFLTKNSLPTEGEISRYATYLAFRFSSNVKKVKKDIIEKVKIHVRNEISEKAINNEINNFLARYPQPTQTEIDEFVNYINLLKLNFNSDNELRQLIEKERLYRRFYKSQTLQETSKLDQFINIIKTNNDKRNIIEALQKKELSYLIKDEAGISDKMLDEFVALMIPIK